MVCLNFIQNLWKSWWRKGYQWSVNGCCSFARGRMPNVTTLAWIWRGLGLSMIVALKSLWTTSLHTTNPKRFAAGDWCSSFKFTHAANIMTLTVICNPLFLKETPLANLLIHYVTFVDPEIPSIGMYGNNLDTKEIPYRAFENIWKTMILPFGMVWRLWEFVWKQSQTVSWDPLLCKECWQHDQRVYTRHAVEYWALGACEHPTSLSYHSWSFLSDMGCVQ